MITRLRGCAGLLAAGVVVAAVAMVFVIGASAHNTSQAATKAPILLGFTSQIGSSGDNAPDLLASAMVAQKYINAHGGVNGRPVKIDVCNDKNDPNEAAACGRKFVADHVVAIAGNFSYYAANFVPILQAAGISDFWPCCAFSPQELTSPVSFPTNSGATGLALGEAKAAGLLCQRIVLVMAESSASGYMGGLYNAALKLVGKSLQGDPILVPQEGGDYSTEVAQALERKPDCIIMGTAEDPSAVWLSDMKAAGATGIKAFGAVGNLTEKDIAEYPDTTDGGYEVGPYPFSAAPVWNTYWAAFKQYGNPSAFTTLSGIGALAAFAGPTQLVKILKTMPVNNITAKTVFAKLNSMTHYTDPYTPPINFTKQFDAKGINRIFNPTIYVSPIHNGKVVWQQSKVYDITAELKSTAG